MMTHVSGLPELAVLARNVDSQLAAGEISVAEHSRFLKDIEGVLDAHNMTWKQLQALTRRPSAPTRDCPGQLTIDVSEPR